MNIATPYLPRNFNEPLVFDMDIRDLEPKKDPKGGSPKTPYPNIPVRQLETHHHRFNGGWWPVVIRYFISFLCGAVSAGFFFGGKSRDIYDLVQWRGKVDTVIERMDNEGTRYSHWRIDQENKDMAQYDARLKLVEETVKKVDTLILKVEENSKKLDSLRGIKQ